MKLSTFNKIEAAVKTVATVTTLGASQLVATRVRSYQDRTAKDLNARIDVAVADSYVGQKYDGMKTASSNKFEAFRNRMTAEKAEQQPATLAEPTEA